MPRHALRRFFERVIIASLPLAVAGCKGTPSPNPGNGNIADMSAGTGGNGGAGGSGGSGGSGGVMDMAQGQHLVDLATTDRDSCDVVRNRGPVKVIFPPDAVPDGGYFLLNGTRQPSITCPGDMGGCICTDHCPPALNSCISPRVPLDMTGQSGQGGWLVTCEIQCGISGRRPEGLAEAVPTAACSTGHYFATMAHLEAASVHAFRVMARELAAHGAPRSLVARARKAARDEIRHARVTRAFALAHGATPAPVSAAPARLRSLEEIALENAAEGCVRETFGALVAHWQAHTAADPAVRAAMTAIAEDETQHAELSWDLDAWLKTRLDRSARTRVKQAKRDSAATLAAEAAQPYAPELVHALGLPDVDRARELVAAATSELWA